jgi:hypothetical protein
MIRNCNNQINNIIPTSLGGIGVSNVGGSCRLSHRPRKKENLIKNQSLQTSIDTLTPDPTYYHPSIVDYRSRPWI